MGTYACRAVSVEGATDTVAAPPLLNVHRRTHGLNVQAAAHRGGQLVVLAGLRKKSFEKLTVLPRNAATLRIIPRLRAVF